MTDQSEIALKLTVEEDGLYQVTAADLQGAGVDVSALDPRTLRVYNQGQELEIEVTGEEDGSFDPGDVVLFYAQGLDTKYTGTNVYWVTWGGDSGLRLSAVNGTPGDTAQADSFWSTVRAEEDLVYDPGQPSGEDNDHWYWNYVYAPGSATSVPFGISLSHVSTETVTATVRGLLKGYTADPMHHPRIYVNGYLADEATWAPQGQRAFEAEIPQSVLLEGQNTILVEAPCDDGISMDISYVNWFEVTYARNHVAEGDQLAFSGHVTGTVDYRVGGFSGETVEVYDVTSPTAPVRILGAAVEASGGSYALRFERTADEERRFLALTPTQRKRPANIEQDSPSDLRSTANGADYIVITHGDFAAAVQPLSDHRAAQGLRTLVVDVQDVYDEFSGGLFDPEAIRSFLSYAYANWTPPAPSYVLLVGDGNYDFRDSMGWGEPNYIPPYLMDVDPWIGETAADNRYVCVSGDDLLPDMHLGRLPVKSSVQVDAIVSKILAYEQPVSPEESGWQQRVLFVADNPDDGGDFYSLSDNIAAGYLPESYTADKVYYGQTHGSSSAARQGIVDALNEGRLLVNYIGHAGQDAWATERFWSIADIGSLANGDRLPVMVPMSCWDGYYINPSLPGYDFSSLSESIVRASGKGAVASWAPTGMGLALGHEYLNEALYEAILSDGVNVLGAATTQAKLHLYSATSGHRELLDTYALFGDPALRIPLPSADVTVEAALASSELVAPGDVVTYTLTYANDGAATASQVTIASELPSVLLNPIVVSSGAAITPRSGSQFTWDVSDLAAGQGGTIVVTAEVDESALPGTIAIEVTITTATEDADPEDNHSETAVTVVHDTGTGPGGVGAVDGQSALAMWLAADKVSETDSRSRIETWFDLSGSGNDVTQTRNRRRPTLLSDADRTVNGKPVVGFDGYDYLMRDIPDRHTHFTLSLVSVSAGSSSENRYAFASSPSSSAADTFQVGIGSHRCAGRYKILGEDSSRDRFAVCAGEGSTEAQITSVAWDGTRLSTLDKGGSLRWMTVSLDPLFEELRVGTNRSGGRKHSWYGDIAEVILYWQDLNTAERVLVDNYLAAKYDIAIQGSDRYGGDLESNGDYDLDVVGIGQESDGSSLQAHSAGLILVGGNYVLDDGDYLLVGHNTPTNGTTSSDLPEGVTSRWTRVWYLDRTDTNGNGGTVEVLFDLSAAGMEDVPEGGYTLLTRSGATGTFEGIAATTVVQGDRIIFRNVDVTRIAQHLALGVGIASGL